MTWDELKEKAKELGYKEVEKLPFDKIVIALVNKKGLAFYRSGTIEYDCDNDTLLCGRPIAFRRTYEQMYAIMGALK
jgi:hypothetical protein